MEDLMVGDRRKPGAPAPRVPAKYKPLYHKRQRATWTAAELEWLFKDPKLPPLLVWIVNEKLRGGRPDEPA
jgi:hypothetical protein